MTFLLDVTLRSSILLAMGLTLMPLLRRQSAALRHLVLYACLMCAAAMPLATWLVPQWQALDVAGVLPEPVIDSVAPLAWARQPDRRLDALQTGAVTGSTAQSLIGAVDAIVLPIWLTGAVLSVLMLGIGLARLYRIDARSALVQNSPWQDGLPPSATVRMTHCPGLLLVWGALRPTIIVPTAALSWAPERVSVVLHHEAAHIRRRDWILQIGAELVRAVYWFHPLVWIACARLRAESEIACDDAVIAEGAAGLDYATHVVEIARELTTERELPAPAIVRASTLERRVRAMLDHTRNRKPLSLHIRGVALGIVLAATVAVAGLAAQSFVSLSGTIVDPSNGVLPGTKLILVNEQTQAKYEIQTDGSGRYEFVGLPPGSYTLEAALPGFSRFSAQVAVGTQNLQQDLTMSIGMIQETVTVRQDAVPPPPDPERDRRIEAFKQKRAQQHVSTTSSSAAASGDVRIGGNIRVPLKLRDLRPAYPHSMRGTEGVVVLHAQIGTTGSVEHIEVASSSHPDFSEAAIDAVRQWEFDATLLNGAPIVTPMQVTVNFRVK